MPELAEVEYYRKRWDPGLGARITKVALHGKKRVFRGSESAEIERQLQGATLKSSTTHGKQMLFVFSREGWLGVHLGMTGSLRVEAPDFTPGTHDHLVLYQAERALVFEDARMFGRIRFSQGPQPPAWWAELPPAIESPDFTVTRVTDLLQRRSRSPLKGVLLDQEAFPGIGNWMADEILWQLRLSPTVKTGDLDEPTIRLLWKTTRQICRTAIKTIGKDWSDPPKTWLLHQRFLSKGHCPRDHHLLQRCIVATRTSVFCPICQIHTSTRALRDERDRRRARP